MCALATLAALLAVAGCGGSPEIDAGSLSGEEADACRRLVAALPEEVAGQTRVEVSGDTEYGAAWGDPAIVLTCGVPQPSDFTRTSSCVEANGVGWFLPDSVLLSDDQTRDVTMTAVGYRPRVRVFLPGDYRPSGFMNAAGAIGAVVGEHLELVQECL